MPRSHTLAGIGKFVFDIVNEVDRIPIPGDKFTAKSQVVVSGGGVVNAMITVAQLKMNAHALVTIPSRYFRSAAEEMLHDAGVTAVARLVNEASFNNVYTGVGDRAIVRAPKREYESEDFARLEPEGYDGLLL